MSDELFNAPASPQPAPPQIIPSIERDANGMPVIVILAGVPACQTRLTVDPQNAGALGRALLQLERTAGAMLIVPNGNAKPITP